MYSYMHMHIIYISLKQPFSPGWFIYIIYIIYIYAGRCSRLPGSRRVRHMKEITEFLVRQLLFRWPQPGQLEWSQGVFSPAAEPPRSRGGQRSFFSFSDDDDI